MKHITKQYSMSSIMTIPTYCGSKPKTIWEVTNNTLMQANCPKCIDLYYQDHSNADCGTNPYFNAHNSEGNKKLRIIKAKKLKKEGSIRSKEDA